MPARWGFGFVYLCCLLASPALTTPIGLADDAPPRVLGYERVYVSSDKDALAAGQLLLGELNCTSCHQAEPSGATAIQRKPAPILDTVGQRVKPQYLLKFLADPQATKPGTTMPNVLAGISPAQREPIVESIVHFLATTGNVTNANPSRHAVDRGEALFHSIGCVACHDGRSEPAPQPLATSIALGTPSRKFTLPGLTQFLQDPLAVRPGGRMPHLNLTAAEARDIASYLLNDLDIVSGLQYAYYEGEWEKLPDFAKLTPTAIGDAEEFDLTPARRRDHFALRYEGTINLDQEGDYLFLIGSDDGSRLLIDDKLILANDGVHPFEQKRKRVKMAPGLHSVVVEYFEHDGEESLQVDFEGPGTQQQPLATLLTTPARQSGTAPPSEPFQVDPVKAAAGRKHFAELGCASCHELRIDGSLVRSMKSDQPLSQLVGRGGCLDGQSGRGARYLLSNRQISALATAMGAAKQLGTEPSAGEVVRRTLVRFNCVACHDREQLGGVLAARDSYFLTDMPEMGDEGRIPPSLTGVGAKLTPAWLKTLFEHGAKDRPYMLTRMPKFGLANVPGLVSALEDADASYSKAAPAITVPSGEEKRIKAAGRRLAGAQGFSCIKCHTFAGQRSSGIQALSLTTMTNRLRRDWFHHYLQNPLAYRPGTRMPTPFPDGQTTLPKLLDGTVDSQIAAIWTYLSDGDKAIYPVGLVTGKIEVMVFDEPVMYRNFLDGAGPRGIGVGYPEKLNLAFDADNLRLAMLWHGAFIDAARHWSARGAGFEKPLGDNVLHLPPGPPLAVLPDRGSPWPAGDARSLGFQFGGYRFDEKKRPTFLYSWQGTQIEDTPLPVGSEDVFSMHRKLTLRSDNPQPNTWLRVVRVAAIEGVGDDTVKIDGRWTLKISSLDKPVLRQQDGQWEVIVPIRFSAKNASIELNYDW